MNIGKMGKRVFFTVVTQGLLSVAAIVISFGLPKYLSVEEYSRWQIFYFYVAYVNFFQLGFNDGFVLNYSGLSFPELPWKNVRKATAYIVSILMLGVMISLFFIFSSEIKDKNIYVYIILSIIPTVLMCIMSAVLLAGCKTYQYNLFSLFIKICFVFFVVFGMLFDFKNAEFYILGDILSKLFITGIYIWLYRTTMKKDVVAKQDTLVFIKENCVSGIMVTITVLLISLMPMCGRVIIQFKGTTEQYAMFSFAISMLSIILTFTNAIGVVAFPLLKNNNDKDEMQSFNLLSKIYDEILITGLGVYFIIQLVLEYALEKYVSVLEYFPILFIACWPLGKIQILLYPYYKVYRKEKIFLKISIVYSILMMISCFVSFLHFGLLGLSVATFFCVLFYYEHLRNFFYKKIINLDNACEKKILFILALFVFLGMKIKSAVLFALIYGLVIIINFYILFKRWKKSVKSKESTP